MQPWTMWVVGIAVAALPFVLMALFHGPHTVDSRGRPTDRTWRSHPPRRTRPPPGALPGAE